MEAVRDHEKPLGNRLLCQVFVVYVATNMVLCAVVFAPWALPRETISGLLGRWELGPERWKRLVGIALSSMIDRIYFWEPDHCAAVFACEQEARLVLYPHRPGSMP